MQNGQQFLMPFKNLKYWCCTAAGSNNKSNFWRCTAAIAAPITAGLESGLAPNSYFDLKKTSIHFK